MKRWTASHTALLAYYTGKGWSNSRIARRLGFSRRIVQERRSIKGLPNCHEARRGPLIVDLDTTVFDWKPGSPIRLITP